MSDERLSPEAWRAVELLVKESGLQHGDLEIQIPVKDGEIQAVIINPKRRILKERRRIHQ